MNRLLDLLVRKGTITAEEAAELRLEVAIEKQKELDKQAEEEKKKGKRYLVSSRRPLLMSGYAQVLGNLADWGPTRADPVKDSFLIRRARLSLKGSISEPVSYNLQVDFGNEARKVKDDITGKQTDAQRPVLLDMQVNYGLHSKSCLSIGQFKVPFSQENLLPDTELETIELSQVDDRKGLVPGRDNGSQGRDIGITYNGSLSRESGAKMLDYTFGFFNGTGINTSDNNDRKDFLARAVAYPQKGLVLAASYYDGADGISRNRRDRAGLDLAYHFPNGKTYIKGEYVWGYDQGTKKDGWYALLVHNFDSKWQGVVKFDTFDPDVHKGNDASDFLTFGVNRFITDDIKLQLNYITKNEEGVEIPNNTFLSQLQVKF